MQRNVNIGLCLSGFCAIQNHKTESFMLEKSLKNIESKHKPLNHVPKRAYHIHQQSFTLLHQVAQINQLCNTKLEGCSVQLQQKAARHGLHLRLEMLQQLTEIHAVSASLFRDIQAVWFKVSLHDLCLQCCIPHGCRERMGTGIIGYFG